VAWRQVVVKIVDAGHAFFSGVGMAFRRAYWSACLGRSREEALSFSWRTSVLASRCSPRVCSWSWNGEREFSWGCGYIWTRRT
jgi:hypothetical protein